MWESNFEPIIVDEFVGIRASFHPPFKNVQHEIIITPKMSFGTGHHATTFLMMEQTQQLDFNQKSVFDFGTGTGVLAILAKKLNAIKIVANDIDEWGIANSHENFDNNNASDIRLLQSDTAQMNCRFDIILANINRNVLLDNMVLLAIQLHTGGILLLSGILQEDETAIMQAATHHHLQFVEKTKKEKWICVQFLKQ